MATAQHTIWSRNRWGILTGESPISSDIMRAQHESGAENKDWDANNARPRLALDANSLPGKVAYAMKSCFSETHTINGSKISWNVDQNLAYSRYGISQKDGTQNRTYPLDEDWSENISDMFFMGKTHWSHLRTRETSLVMHVTYKL